MGSTDLMEYHRSLPLAAYPAGVTNGRVPDVKWDLEGASAGHSLLEKTAIAVLMDTILTHSAFARPALRDTTVLPTVSSVCVTIEEQTKRCAMNLDAAFAAVEWRDRDVTAANLDTTRFQTVRLVSVMGRVQLTSIALPVASAFACRTIWARTVTSVLLVTTDTQTVLPASALRRARMATPVILFRASACVCRVWWANSVTDVLLG